MPHKKKKRPMDPKEAAALFQSNLNPTNPEHARLTYMRRS